VTERLERRHRYAAKPPSDEDASGEVHDQPSGLAAAEDQVAAPSFELERAEHGRDRHPIEIADDRALARPRSPLRGKDRPAAGRVRLTEPIGHRHERTDLSDELDDLEGLADECVDAAAERCEPGWLRPRSTKP